MILNRIIETKKREVALLKSVRSMPELERMARDLPPARDFKGALAGKDCAIIAEIKRRSPSKGTLREDFDPGEIARIYEGGGAAAISVLTDRDFFGGDGKYLAAVRNITRIPLLRKDFIIDPCQVYETRILGGDALLLIAGLFNEKNLRDFIDLSHDAGLSALVEVHTREEAARAVAAGAEIIGINNRDLRTFRIDLRTSLELASLIPAGRVVVSESGIETRADIEEMMKAGIHAVLVGEVLMRAGDMGEKLRELRKP
jgi:indole-3-glycerol phosphate synthase